MSEKEKKGIRKHLKTVLEKLYGGLETGALRGGNEEVPHSTLHEILELLKGAGVIFKAEDGKWYYTWKKEKEELVREYQNYTMDEYPVKLQHAKDLLGSAIDKARIGDHRLAMDSLIYGENISYFLQHLDSGYIDTHKLYDKWKEDKAGEEKAKKAFNKEIKRIAVEKGFEIKKYLRDLKEEKKQVSSAIFNSIKRYCKLVIEGKLKERVKLELRYEGVFDPVISECIAINKNIKTSLEDLIKTCIHSESVESLCRICKNIEDKENEDYSVLIGRVIKIVRDVELGKPLEGSCDACRFIIGRK